MEHEYLDRIKQGDTEAFSYFVMKYTDVSYSLAYSIVKNESEAEDIVQASFFKAYKEIKNFRGDSKFSSWLYRIVVNESNQRLRKKKFRFVGEEKIVKLEEEKSSHDPDRKERKRILRYAISKLNEKEALLIRLFYLCELSHEEVSKVTGLSVSNTKVILHRAKNNLKEILESEYKEEFKPYP